MTEEERQLPHEQTAHHPCAICDKPLGVGGSRMGSAQNGVAHASCAQPKDTFEARACKRCGHERKAKVMRGWRGGKEFVEYLEEYCSACKCLNSAENHERQAQKMRAQAAAIVAARRLKVLGKS